VNNTVGLAPTQELVSRDGMIEPGLNTRVGPICRTVEDAARILDAYAGYDPKDELTIFAVGRTPSRSYASYAGAGRLDGVRIGVIREYMNRSLLAQADEESLAIIERAADDLRRLGATIVDPGPEGALFQGCVDRYGPELYNSSFASRYPDLFPVGPDGQPTGDHIETLIDMRLDPSLVPDDFTFRTLGRFGAPGESRYMMDRYLRERGDPNVTSNADLVNKATFYDDPNFPDRRAIRQRAENARALDTAERMQHRFAVQTIVLQCMQEQTLDALLAPTASVPPPKLTAPREPNANGRSPVGWSMLGQQGFPVLTVPAGFTVEVWDRVRNDSGEGPARLVGPVPARLPVGMDLVGRPFDEPLLFRIAAAYEAATRHREPPADFGPVGGER
jgi:Asp-tRNA(Asn)/Glu-tRNA(Gln) amidotransferase A subunit family amidase